jgi:cytidyltransferase-like protein
MNFLNEKNIYYFKKYQYQTEDNCFLSYYYFKIWNYLSKFIPRKIHPNIITFLGLITIIVGYNLSKIYEQFSNLIMGLGMIGYMYCDGIDGIHARNTKQTSIVGEYFDHLVDLSVSGIILTYGFEMMGLKNILINKILIILSTFEFVRTHYKAISTKKIIFSGSSDVSMVTTLTSLIIFLNPHLPLYLIDNQWMMILPLMVITFLNVNNIIRNKFTKPEENNFKNIYLSYWLIRFITLFLNTSNLYWSYVILDMLIMIETINIKIFSSQLLNKYLILGLPILHLFSPIISNLYIILYLFYFIYSISKQLKITLLVNPPSVYLPRIYCCGVFDMCHLGHMKLFEKISKSFNHPIWLIVGVHSDSTVKSYKREPIINETFRVETISLCKYVDEVYPDAELIVTKEFCIEHQIDCVIIGEEYKDNKDNMWYAGGMELGIHKYISRFEELSTSDIIKKVKNQE